MTAYRLLTKLFSYKFTAPIFRTLFLNSFVIHTAYGHTYNAKKKLSGLSPEELKDSLDFEVYLWQANDLRTYMFTSVQFLNVDNCRVRVEMPLWHVAMDADRYFDSNIVEQHLRIIFPTVHIVKAKFGNHAPSIVADAAAAAPFIPPKIRQQLNKAPA